VALAVLDAPKLSDGEVEKFASQKNVLEAVLRQIPMKRRFMKLYTWCGIWSRIRGRRSISAWAS